MNASKVQGNAAVCAFVVVGATVAWTPELGASPLGVQQSPEANRAAPAPLDLVGDRDPNGLLLNPTWAVQRILGPNGLPSAEAECGFRVATNWYGARHLELHRSPLCTSQPLSLHEPLEPKYAGVACNAGEEVGLPEGHINWFPATYTGPILWGNYATDQDYDLFLVTDARAGQTEGNRSQAGMELEFDAREFVDRIVILQQTKWSHLISAAESNSSGDIKAIINGKYAIATGLLGLDGIHNAHAELHPVWALAVEVNTDPTHDVWMVFARNLGNEGECGSGQLPLLFNTAGDSTLAYSFAIPWTAGASSVAVLWGRAESFFVRSNQRIKGPFLRADSGKALNVTFRLPRATTAADYAVVYGELHLRWPGAVSGRPVITADSLRALISLKEADTFVRAEAPDLDELVARANVRMAVRQTPQVPHVPDSLIPPHDSEPSWGPLPIPQPWPLTEEPVFYQGEDERRAEMRRVADEQCRHPKSDVIATLCRPLPRPTTSLYIGLGSSTTVTTSRTGTDLLLAAGIRIPAGDARLPVFHVPVELRAATFVTYTFPGARASVDEWGFEGSVIHCLWLCGYQLQSLVAVGTRWTINPDTARAFRVFPAVGLRTRIPIPRAFVDRWTIGLRAAYLLPKGRGLLIAYADIVL